MTESDKALQVLIDEFINLDLIDELKELAESMIKFVPKEKLHKGDYDNFVRIEFYLLGKDIKITNN